VTAVLVRRRHNDSASGYFLYYKPPARDAPTVQFYKRVHETCKRLNEYGGQEVLTQIVLSLYSQLVSK